MRVLKSSFAFLFSFLFFSCISVSSFNNYTKEKQDRPVNYEIVVRSAIVEDNYVENKDIENQVSKNLETMYFESQKNINAKNNNRDILVEQLFLDIVITQRTFIKNIDTCNSIFLNARLVDSNGTIVLQNCLNRETKNTIVSSYEQNRLCKYIFMKTNHFVLDNLKSK